MSDTVLQLSLLILASLYIGLVLGKRFGRGDVTKQLEAERERLRAEVESEHKELAVELHGELSKVRDSIVQSAQAYQNVVNTIDQKLAPWAEIQKSLPSKSGAKLPLLIVEEASSIEADTVVKPTAATKPFANPTAEGAMAQPQTVPQTVVENTGDEETALEEGPSLHEKAAQLVREDRVAAHRKPDLGSNGASVVADSAAEPTSLENDPATLYNLDGTSKSEVTPTTVASPEAQSSESSDSLSSNSELSTNTGSLDHPASENTTESLNEDGESAEASTTVEEDPELNRRANLGRD